jgi:hypothetical protein
LGWQWPRLVWNESRGSVAKIMIIERGNEFTTPIPAVKSSFLVPSCQDQIHTV